MTGEQIRSGVGRLLRSAFEHSKGSRPRRYQPQPDVLDELRELAGHDFVRATSTAGPWRVTEGRRWLLNRRLDGRSVPLVQRDHAAIVVRSWGEARELAALLNWCDVPPPPRGGPGMPAYLTSRLR